MALSEAQPTDGWPDESLVVQTTDLDRAREMIGKVYAPYRFDAHLANPHHPAVMHRIRGQAIELSEFSYGNDIVIEAEVFSNFLLVLTTASGQAEISTTGFMQRGTTGMTVVTSSDDLWKFRYSADNQQYVLRIALDRTKEIAASLTGAAKPLKPSFSPVMSDVGMQRRWAHQVGHLRELLDPNTPACVRNLLLPRVEEMLITSLLLQQSGNVIEAMHSASADTAPAILRRAIDFIQDQLDQPLTLEDVACAARCSVRSLHRAFRTHRDVSVMQYIKSQRMQRVRLALMDAADNSTITHIAFRWGFTQLGQFAADYRALFGEKPSDTRRKR